VTRPGSDEVLGTTPVELSLPRATGTVDLVLKKKGYLPKTIKLPLDDSSERTVPLVRRRAVDPDEWRKL
jgi:hypothetical protein